MTVAVNADVGSWRATVVGRLAIAARGSKTIIPPRRPIQHHQKRLSERASRAQSAVDRNQRRAMLALWLLGRYPVTFTKTPAIGRDDDSDPDTLAMASLNSAFIVGDCEKTSLRAIAKDSTRKAFRHRAATVNGRDAGDARLGTPRPFPRRGRRKR